MGGQVDWVRFAHDGSILVGGWVSGIGETRFHRTGAADLTVASSTFVAHLDRQANVNWVLGPKTLSGPALLPDGAMVFIGALDPGSALSFSVWRAEADGSLAWRRDFADEGLVFYSVRPTPDGNVIVVGWALPTVDLDPGPGTAFTPNPGPFFINLSGTTGEVFWIRTPTEPRSYAHAAVSRPDGRLIVEGYLSTPNGEVDLLYTLASDGMADPEGWRKELPGGLCGWTMLASGDLLTCEVNENSFDYASYLRVLDSATGRERSLQGVSGIYDELVAGPTRVVGRMTDFGADRFWILDWWSSVGLLEGSLVEDFDPPEHRLYATTVDVDPNGAIVLGASVVAPAGTTLDLDPGPAAVPFVTPNDGAQLAIIQLSP